MKRLKLKDKYYKIIDGFDVNESSREVKYSNVKIDFTKKGIADLPLKYQECQLIDGDIEEKKASEGETIEGTSLSIDYDEDRNFEYNLKGQIQQETTNGINLLESSLDIVKANNTSGTWNDNVYTYQGVSFTYNSDGSITANGTASTTIQFYISRTGGSYLYTILESGSYYLTSHETTGANNTWKVQFADENQNSWNVHGTGNNKEVNLTLSQSTNIRAYVVVYSGKNPNGARFYPMIAKTSGIDYVPYDTGYASPSPEHQQPINITTGRQVVSVGNNNLVNFNELTTNGSATTYTWTNDILTITATSGSYSRANMQIVDIYKNNPGKTIRFDFDDFDFTNGKSPSVNLQVINNGTTTYYPLVNSSGQSLNHTITSDTSGVSGVMLRMMSNNTSTSSASEISFTKPILHFGDSKIPYEEYKVNDYEINLGKQLWQLRDRTVTTAGITAVVENGEITLNGTATATAFCEILLDNVVNWENGETYTISGFNPVLNNGVRIRTASTGANDITLTTINRVYSITHSSSVSRWNDRFTIRVENGTTLTDFIIKPQLEKGTGTSYTPYKTPIYLGENDYIKQSTGKNLLENKVRTQTTNGITFTKNDDGSITINGTASGGNAYLNLYNQYEDLVKDTTKTYTFSIGATSDDIELTIGEKISGSSAVVIVARGNAPSITYTPSGRRDGQIFRIGVKNTKTINNLTIYPQVEEGELSDYEPYGKGIWYYKNNWGRVVLNGSETYSLNTEGFTITQSNWNNLTNDNCMSKSILLSNYYKNYTTYADLVAQNYGIGIIYSGAKNLYIRNTDITSVANFKTWLSTHNVEVYYMLATPKYTIIEDTELLEQLSSIKLLSGTNNIFITSTNLPLIMNLHYNYNEDIEIVTENEVIYTGYVNNYTLPKMKNKLEYRELDIDLLSPLALATLRTADAIGTYNLQSLIREIIQPLIDDGFTLKELNVGNNQISVNYLTETIESALNKLSNKFNFWWFIDKNKNIYINDIKYIFNKKEKAIYDDDNKINGLIDFTPSMESVDYFNTIDFTNVRLVTKSHYQKDQTTTSGMTNISYLTYNPLISKDYIEPGEEIEFEIPFIINTDKRGYSNTSANVEQGYFRLYKIVSEGTIDEVVSLIPDINNDVIIPSNATITDNYNEDKEFVFVKDSFFDNLIVGMKYNGSNKINVGLMVSDTALMWTKVRINDNREIEFNKDIISTSGIIEKQIDMNEQWLTYEELLEISNSLIGNNNVNVEKVEILTDVENNYNVGDIISINKPNFLTYGDFIITDKKRRYEDNVDQWTFTLNNTNILESYIDLFRNGEQEEQSDKVYNLITGDYAREIIAEKYEVEVL